MFCTVGEGKSATTFVLQSLKITSNSPLLKKKIRQIII